MKKLFLLLSLLFPILIYGQISLPTRLVAGTNITLDQAGNTYTVNATGGGVSSQWIQGSGFIHYDTLVGIGTLTATPTAKLHIKGATATTGFGLKVDDMNDVNLFSVKDNGYISAGMSQVCGISHQL